MPTQQFTKNQHWVPRFYLRYFLSKFDQNKLFVTDTKQFYMQHEGATGSAEHESKRKAIEKLACHEYLYSELKSDIWTNELEDAFFQNIERAASIAFQKCFDRTADISTLSGEKCSIALFLAALHLRHPRMVAVGLSKERKDVPLGSTPEDVALRSEFREIQYEAAEIAPTILLRDWDIYEFEDPLLVTSDTPFFIVEGPEFKPSHLKSNISICYFPISPRHMLSMRAPGVKVTKSISGIFTDPKLASFFNRFIINFSETHVYSSSRLNTEWARDVTTSGRGDA